MTILFDKSAAAPSIFFWKFIAHLLKEEDSIVVRFVPYDPVSHQLDFLELNIEFIEFIANQMRVNRNIDPEIHGGGQTIQEYVEMYLAKFTKIQPPRGIIYIVESEGKAIGMGALSPLVKGVGEIKRMYVRPAHRGKGIGREMLEFLLQEATALGYTKIRLDTLKSMKPAQSLYRAYGFREIAEYPESEIPLEWRIHFAFFEKDLEVGG